MAPKKTDQKDLKEVQAAAGEWSISKCSHYNLTNLVLGGLLQERDLINWRLPFRDPFPMESVDEIVSFCSFSERRFALPTCSFFRGLLYFYLAYVRDPQYSKSQVGVCIRDPLSLGLTPMEELLRRLTEAEKRRNGERSGCGGGSGGRARAT
jgi:hypothetical protein